jgi:hypothetical protein
MVAPHQAVNRAVMAKLGLNTAARLLVECRAIAQRRPAGESRATASTKSIREPR